MLNRLLLVVILVPLAVVLVALSVANRGLTAVTLDPINPGNPALTLSLPLFVWLFAAVALGLLLGGAVTWLRQGFYRRLARIRAREADTLRQQAARAPAPVFTPAPAPAPGPTTSFAAPAPSAALPQTTLTALPKPSR